MLPDFDDYCLGYTCRFDKTEDKTISCPNGYGDIQFYKVKYGSDHSAEGIVLLQEECSSQMAEVNGVCTFNVSEMLGSEPIDDTTAESEPESEEIVEGGEVMLTHSDPNSVKAYFLCNKIEESPEMMLMRALTPAASMEETFPFLSVAFVKCDTRKWKANYLEGAKACDTTGSFSLTCNPDADLDARILVVKVYPKDKGPKPTDKAGKKEKKKAAKKLAAAANDKCGGQGGSCDFTLEEIFEEGAEIPAGKWKVDYLCSYGQEIANPDEEPLMLGSPYAMDEETETYPLLTAEHLACEGTKPLGQYVENGKSCSGDNIVLQCGDEARNPRIIIAKFRPTKVGPKETDPAIKAQNKSNGKERTRNANNFCGDSANLDVVDGMVSCSFDPVDYLAEADEFDVDQLFDVKYFCLYESI
jgi:hypothetical protein